MKFTGDVWKFGDNIGATDLVSSAHDDIGMGRQWAECAKHVLEELDPEFPSKVKEGDILVAGEKLGVGHAHYYPAAIMGSSAAGLAGLFAESVGALFQRNAIDLGVPIWPLPGISKLVENGDRLELDLSGGKATNVTTGKTMEFKPISPVILEILEAGGSTNWGLRRVGKLQSS
jgi:3-isopropylmalate/(R)-2-methylmalate dehydratase small subunit